MARYTNKRVIQQSATLACGSVNQNNLLDLVVPSPNATLMQVVATQKTATADTGTFGIQVMYTGSPTAIGPATATNFITVNATTGAVHGTHSPKTSLKDQEGKRLGITTVKAGTVATDATVIFTFTWLV